jgi:glycosyltransferase involved in cell wall biosynthesis
MSLDAVYVTYWSLQDPLCQSQSLPVLRGLAARGYRLGLVTFEQPRWALGPSAQREAHVALQQEGISWFPRTYHKRPPVLSTLADVMAGAWTVAWVVWRQQARLVHARATVPGLMGYLGARLTGARFFNDADGPLSEEYVDAGIWKRGSWVQRLTAGAERLALHSADRVAVLSHPRRHEVAPFVKGEVAVLPCAVDTALFRPRPEERAGLREALGLTGTVLVYAGKWGGWYATAEMLDFVRVARDSLGEVTLLVLTPEDPQRFLQEGHTRDLRCVVRAASRNEMPGYLSAADVGLSFVLPAPSKRACSPVKNGEYLACGLPIVSTPGIGDYSDLIEGRGLGVVVERMDRAAYGAAAAALQRVLGAPDLSERCRRAAQQEVGLAEVVVPRYLEIYEALLGAPAK